MAKTNRQTRVVTHSQHIAKVFMSGASQAVRIPQAFRFECETVSIRRQGESLILTPVAETWDELCTGDPSLMDDAIAAALDDSDLLSFEQRAELR